MGASQATLETFPYPRNDSEEILCGLGGCTPRQRHHRTMYEDGFVWRLAEGRMGDWVSTDLTCPAKDEPANALTRDVETIAQSAGQLALPNALNPGSRPSIPPP